MRLHLTLKNPIDIITKKESRVVFTRPAAPRVKRAASCSPALLCSTIGAGGLNFSVRNGKRWDPAAIATPHGLTAAQAKPHGHSPSTRHPCDRAARRAAAAAASDAPPAAEAFGQLVALGFGVAASTPAPYQRRGLRRPSKRSPHLAAGFALRCFQRLSRPGTDTRRCPWRDNRRAVGLSATVLSY